MKSHCLMCDEVNGRLEDTADLTLDVVVTENGEVVYEDEDELTWTEEQSVYSHDESERIRRIGREAHTHASQGGWPLGAD